MDLFKLELFTLDIKPGTLLELLLIAVVVVLLTLLLILAVEVL